MPDPLFKAPVLVVDADREGDVVTVAVILLSDKGEIAADEAFTGSPDDVVKAFSNFLEWWEPTWATAYDVRRTRAVLDPLGDFGLRWAPAIAERVNTLPPSHRVFATAAALCGMTRRSQP